MNFFSISLFCGKYIDFLESIKNPTKKILVFTPNPEIFVHASRDEEFLNILKKATYNTPDANWLYVGAMMQEGIGFFRACFVLLFAKKKLREQYGDLIKGSDLTRDLLNYASETKKNILILDNRVENIVSEFDQKKSSLQQHLGSSLEQKYPWLTVRVVYVWDIANDGIAHLIELQDISYVFSCLGMRKQEKELIEIFSYLPWDQRVVGLGVGASIDFLFWLQKRAPILWQKMWLEWLYRLIMEPRKRWRRIYTAVVEFPNMIKNTSPD